MIQNLLEHLLIHPSNFRHFNGARELMGLNLCIGSRLLLSHQGLIFALSLENFYLVV